jgi:AraC-like DNA-binding protein
MPLSKVLAFADPFSFKTAISTADLELVPTARGQFSAELISVCMNQLWIKRFYQNLPLINTGTMKPGRRVFTFLVSSEPAAMRHCGMEVLSGDIIVNNFDEMHQRTEAGFRMGSMSLTIDDLDAACKATTGREFRVAPFKHLVRPSPALMSRLLELHETVGEIARTMPDLLEAPEVVRALEQQLVYLMVRCLTEGTVSTMTNGSYRHDKIMARFEAYLEAHPREPLYLTEICAAVGASERTLRIACAKHLGIGPIRYLALRRMHLVRRALLRGDSSTTVTRVATDHGFWELGRFAVAYRILFGETPSASLHRPSDGLRISLNRPSSLESPILHS